MLYLSNPPGVTPEDRRAQLDALEHAYATPGRIPPGAFRPDGA